MNAGLVSVTFRKLTPKEIIDLSVRAGIGGIEWGGDIHVSHGDVHAAREVALRTREAGLQVASYGSYYRCEGDFNPVLETALALDAPLIRVWAGSKGSAEATAQDREAVVGKARESARMCRQAGIELAFEYHDNTLTDTLASTVRLLEEVHHARTYFQPPSRLTDDENVAALKTLSPRVPAMHVFASRGHERRQLADGEGLWKRLLPEAKEARWALLEFVLGDAPEQFLADAATLLRWLS